MSRRWMFSGCLILLLAVGTAAQTYTLGSTGFDFSGDVAVTFTELDKHTQINTNTRGDDPFNTVRSRLYVQKQWTDDISLYLEFLYDIEATPRIQGAYFTFRNFLHEMLALKVGMIPSPFGNFGHRSTYFNQNPLISVPALWLTKVPISTTGDTHNEDLFPYRITTGHAVYAGGYDACWDYGMDLFIKKGILEAQLAWTLAAISNPTAKSNDGYQGIANLGLHPTPGLRFGASVAYGPWIDGGADLYEYYPSEYSPASVAQSDGGSRRVVQDEYSGHHLDIEDFMQTALGGYAEYSWDRFQFWSEAATITWEMPYIYEGQLTANTGYVSGVWTFLPGWELAGRFNRVWYGEVAPHNDGSGNPRPWAPDFSRYEAGLNWRVIREGFIRLDYQKTVFDTEQLDDIDLLALQFMFAF